MAGAGYKDWVPGDVPTADQFDQYLMQQSNMVFTDAAARDAALATVKAEGMVAVVKDENRIYVYDGSDWQRTGYWAASGRTGVTALRNAAQSISPGSATLISWDAETGDSDGFITPTSTTVTIPTGLGGLYALTARVVWASTPTAGAMQFVAGGIAYSMPTLNSAGNTHGYNLTMPLSAADTVQFAVYQNSAGAINVTGAMFVYRIGL